LAPAPRAASTVWTSSRADHYPFHDLLAEPEKRPSRQGVLLLARMRCGRLARETPAPSALR
jgi:hypothetical protein